MNLYKVTQDINNTWDSFNGMIVAADNEQEARNIHPGGIKNWGEKKYQFAHEEGEREWISKKDIEKLTVELIGIALENIKAGTILLTDFTNG